MESWVIMGHDSRSFWKSGLLDFMVARSAYMKSHGLEEARVVTEEEFDSQYSKAAEILKSKGML